MGYHQLNNKLEARSISPLNWSKMARIQFSSLMQPNQSFTLTSKAWYFILKLIDGGFCVMPFLCFYLYLYYQVGILFIGLSSSATALDCYGRRWDYQCFFLVRNGAIYLISVKSTPPTISLSTFIAGLQFLLHVAKLKEWLFLMFSENRSVLSSIILPEASSQSSMHSGKWLRYLATFYLSWRPVLIFWRLSFNLKGFGSALLSMGLKTASFIFWSICNTVILFIEQSIQTKLKINTAGQWYLESNNSFLN